MKDNPRKKKLDSKRIALGQKHEMNYIKRIAKEIIKEYDEEKNLENCGYGKIKYLKYSPQKIVRLAKAFLKITKRK